jgi:2-C-methyl-D-erythritol 4-phosphate cytidylyltransferase
MGFDKLTADLGGCPLFIRTLERFDQCSRIDEIILVTHEGRTKLFANLVREYGLEKVTKVVPGDADRHLSVWNGLKVLHERTELVAVHDGARPLISSSTIAQTIALAEKCGAVALGVPVVETLKRADSDGLIVSSVDRSGLWTMQTPQVFKREWLVAAYKKVLATGVAVTDETSAMELSGFPVQLLKNSDWNLKVTYPNDLEMVRCLFSLERSKTPISELSQREL